MILIAALMHRPECSSGGAAHANTHQHTAFGYLTNPGLLVNHFVTLPEGCLVPSPASTTQRKKGRKGGRKKERKRRERANECTVSLKAFPALA